MITIIVAADKNNLIGKKGTDNGMPWHNSEDFKHFRSTTLNHTLLMGKTTYQAIGKPLPKRHTIVLSHNFEDERVEVVDDLVGTIQSFKERGEDLFISGGASVYKQALPYCDQIPGNYFQYSNYNSNQWEKAHRISHIFFIPVYPRHRNLRIHSDCNDHCVQ